MNLSPKTKRDLRRILPFGLIWMVFGIVFLTVELAATNNQEQVLDSAIRVDFKIFVFAILTITAVGFLVGFLELVIVNRLFKNKSFKIKLFLKLLLYSTVLSIVIFVSFMIAASIELQLSVIDLRVWNKYVTFFFSITHLSTIMQIGFSLLISLIYAEISENIGQNVLYNFFTGKYHKPIQEERVFMFSDMKSSTHIAERLGHTAYFDFLRSYYQDLSDAIINNHGEVYQYIGDEIVISWDMKKRNSVAASLKCYFEMKSHLHKRKDYYTNTFGVFPDFKAGIHLGNVTAGEIGALKKEIVFTGDVLNTTARIQGLCNEFNSDVLVTEAIMIHLKKHNTLEYNFLGQTHLKGKSNPIQLFTVLNI